MNSNSQFEVHPDAESLNAFVEGAVAVAEREHLLAHLAACGRCRQVVYLAQQAAADAEMAVRVAPAVAARQKRRWFESWNVVWVPALALTAALALVVTFHPRQNTKAPETARVTPDRGEKITSSALPPEAKGKAARLPGAEAVSRPKAKSTKSVAGGASSGAGVGSGAGSSGIQAEAGLVGIAQAEGDVTPRAPGPPPAMITARAEAAQFKPEPTVAAQQQEQQQRIDALSSAGPSAKSAQPRMRETAGKAQASRQLSLAGATPRSAAAPVSASSYEGAIPAWPMAETGPLPKPRSVKLPSGLAAVSTAQVKDHMVAVDLAGELFLSTDIGRHWEPVARQWTGRAIQVRTPKATNGDSSPAPAFELVTDGGLAWVSADGKAWTAK